MLCLCLLLLSSSASLSPKLVTIALMQPPNPTLDRTRARDTAPNHRANLHQMEGLDLVPTQAVTTSYNFQFAYRLPSPVMTIGRVVALCVRCDVLLCDCVMCVPDDTGEHL